MYWRSQMQNGIEEISYLNDFAQGCDNVGNHCLTSGTDFREIIFSIHKPENKSRILQQ